MHGLNHRTYDVVVVGSGAGGMLSAIRCHDLGLNVAVVEKSNAYGGTTAFSAGQFWVPGNHLMDRPDDRALVEKYLRTVTRGSIDERKMRAYLDLGPEMTRYLDEIGCRMAPVPAPDYFPELEGGTGNRAVAPTPIDAAELGQEFTHLRDPSPLWRIFNRYSMDTEELLLFASRMKGWRLRFIALVSRYWLDLPWRMKTHRDRRLTMGNALIAQLRLAMKKRGIPLYLNTALVSLAREGNRVTGGVFERDGAKVTMSARRAIILAAGGFEHNQELRDRYLAAPTSTDWSLTPGANRGDALKAGLEIGADTEGLENVWWFPTAQLPSTRIQNNVAAHGVFRKPHCILVNRLGKRFVNESSSYDRVGWGMLADARASHSTPSCWMIFDRHFRRKYSAGGLMPSDIMPDARVPPDWWDHYVFRASSVGELADLIDVPRDALEETVTRQNGFAAAGSDRDFGRGDTEHDRAYGGDPAVGPNPCLGAIDRPPYYAIRVDLGDIGTKGGLKVDEAARVIGANGRVIDGLYAIGNSAGSMFGPYYPGPGVTIGPAMIFGYAAANDVASSATIGRDEVGAMQKPEPARAVIGARAPPDRHHPTRAS